MLILSFQGRPSTSTRYSHPNTDHAQADWKQRVYPPPLFLRKLHLMVASKKLSPPTFENKPPPYFNMSAVHTVEYMKCIRPPTATTIILILSEHLAKHILVLPLVIFTRIVTSRSILELSPFPFECPPGAETGVRPQEPPCRCAHVRGPPIGHQLR